MRILVTGISGFIGQTLVEVAADTPSVQILGMARCSDSLPDATSSGLEEVMIVPDISTWTVDGASAALPVDAVIHLAGLTHGGYSEEELHRVNVEGAVNVARQALKLGARRFVYVSSAKVFGDSSRSDRRWTPDDVPRPSDPYGQSKLMAERRLEEFARHAGLELTIVRPPLVYGASAKGNFALLKKLIAHGLPLPLASTRNCRSFISARSLCAFLLTCAQHPHASNQIFHVSDAADISTAEFCRRIGSDIDRSARLVPFPVSILRLAGKLLRRDSATASLVGSFRLDSTKSSEMLPWHPEPTFGAQSAAAARHARPPVMLRALDVAFSSLFLVAFSPIMAAIYLLGLADTGSPLFRQQRVGIFETPFILVKFRTMTVGTESIATHLVTSGNVTRLGRFLRASKLDELPQLFNVLKGDMSLVGPRPCLPSQQELISARRTRGVFFARPGVTGLAQIRGVDMSQPQELAELDAAMLQDLTLSRYLSLLILTASGKGLGDRVRHD